MVRGQQGNTGTRRERGSMRKTGPRASIRMLWGLAKSPELSMDDEDLYSLVARETGKESLRALTQGELDRVAKILENQKDKAKVRETGQQAYGHDRGRLDTAAQRRKIYRLTQELGWADNPKRIQGFIQSLFGKGDPVTVYRLELLTKGQCSTVIEALKKMVERKEKEDGSEEVQAHDPEAEGNPGTGEKRNAGKGNPAAG